ncbi:MAG TPA: YlbF family regulator [Verrucomicrobiae bacterium]|jgi:cell fate (sporulation/competence/biofilm development) regulator YlbF (YheA/YmcA/DUF963 family)
MPNKIEEKTQELCATIVAQPEMASIRQRIDAFMADTTSRGQYELVNTKGQSLHQKQHAGQPLNGEEIAEFEKHREALLKNPVARGFLEAQDELHEMQNTIQKYIHKTFELGRMPAETDFEEGSCGQGCGCHH